MQEDQNNVPETIKEPEEVQTSYQEPMRSSEKKCLITKPTLVEWILLAGLILLYVLHFTTEKTEQVIPVAFQKAGAKSTSVVFVNIDTLNNHYEFIKVMKADLESTGKRMHDEILAEQTAFEKEAADFQKQVAANTISEEKAKVVYESLMQKQQLLMDKKDRYSEQIADKELKMNLTLLDTVTNFLKRYNRTYKYDYIMGLKTAGEILVANDTLDITSDVLKALNEDYRKKK